MSGAKDPANDGTKILFNEDKNLIGCPSLYHVVPECLGEKPGLRYDRAVFRIADPHCAADEVMQASTTVYRAPSDHWDMYALAETLVDRKDYFRRRRFKHATKVERIIGQRRGIGGASGVNYLRRMLNGELSPSFGT